MMYCTSSLFSFMLEGMKEAIKNLITELTAINERQLEGEVQARKLLENFLHTNGIEYTTDEYTTYIPKYNDWGLSVDGKTIECLPCGYISGEINSKSTILSSTISSQKNLYDSNINFNPYCSEISRSNFYFAPALAISRSDVQAVVEADKVQGFLEVDKVKHISANLLFGNITNPKRVIFTHYDSVGRGAVDNASGTALTLDVAIQNPAWLDETLFAVCGNEEMSYDEGIYWGHGYREFAEKYKEILETVEAIYVLDSLGHSAPQIISDVSTMTLAFPVDNIDELAYKTRVIAGDLGKLMKFYHADNDKAENIIDSYYFDTYEMLYNLVVQK